MTIVTEDEQPIICGQPTEYHTDPEESKTVKKGTAERRIRKSLLYLRNLRDLRGKYMVFRHADYAEYADSFCFCGICEICVENIGTVDIFRGFMVSSYLKRKENHVQAYAPNGAMVLK